MEESQKSTGLVSRRKAILGMGASAALVATGCKPEVEQEKEKTIVRSLSDIDLDSRAANIEAYLKLISDLSGKPTYRYHTGRILVVPEPKHLGEPFCDFIGIKQDRVRKMSNGTYQHGYRGIILFTNKDTGEVMEAFENPLTGVTNSVSHFKTSRGSIVYTPEGVYPLRVGAEPNLDRIIKESEKPFRLVWSNIGDDTWVTYDERFKVNDEDGKILFADNSMYRYMANTQELLDPEMTSADITMTWSTETNFWDWMDMKGHPGHCIFGSMGSKYTSIDELPKHILAAAEKHLPGHLIDPIKWGDYLI